MKLTPRELKEELVYRFHERLGIICEDQPPTQEQTRQANIEASEDIERLKREE